MSLLYLAGLVAYTWTAYRFLPPRPGVEHRREIPIVLGGLGWAVALAYGLAGWDGRRFGVSLQPSLPSGWEQPLPPTLVPRGA